MAGHPFDGQPNTIPSPWNPPYCIELDGDEIDAELWELSENLHRHDLTKEQRDEHIRRYAALLDAKVQQDAALSEKPAPVTGRGNKGIPRQIAEETGLSVDTVRRALNPPAPRLQMPKEALTARLRGNLATAAIYSPLL